MQKDAATLFYGNLGLSPVFSDFFPISVNRLRNDANLLFIIPPSTVYYVDA